MGPTRTNHKFNVGEEVLVGNCPFCGEGSLRSMKIIGKTKSTYVGDVTWIADAKLGARTPRWAGCDYCCNRLVISAQDTIFVYGKTKYEKV